MPGYAIPRLGFGVYKNYTTTESVIEALKAGYRHIDTAQAYRNEAHVGAALRNFGIKRQEVFITTKIISRHHGREKTMRIVETSLDNIGGGYIDLFLIHDPYAGTKLRLETYKALQDCRREGKIRSVGVSNYGVKHLEEIREAGYEAPSVNQIELHPFCQQRPIVEYCRKNNIVVSAYSPLVHGRIDHAVFRDIANKHSKDAAQILIRWSLQKGFVPLPKSATPARIHSNTQVYDFKLDQDDMERMDALDMGKNGAVTWNPVDVD
ncbi:Aldo/keto reductase [Irpex rosettiformis]|uniref:Aldo/keto reductase n=1 Tax=Irpex rosettiformis TaxID=378272 RepID=A0ACB8UIE0_9APHY|nr:Aldo/keto reductase [Irpex rosettiformis]